MRYDNWDIILFPEDSNIPIPEYKTACYFSRDEDGHELPTLRTYIGSLRPETPFRVSVHHWGLPKPSPFLQQVQRTIGSNINFTVQVIIDGTRLYHGKFAVNTSSPQEIAYEQRSFKSSQANEQTTSQPKKRLLFPRNDKTALLQSSAWQPRGTDNRIKIILSERLINDEGSLDVGCWDIVCFSFQHAPRELLEQAGIAYPIVDPVRSLMGELVTSASQSIPQRTIALNLHETSRIHQEYSPESELELVRPAHPEPRQQPSTRMPSSAIYPPQLMGHRGGGLPGLWRNSHQPFIDDGVSMELWPPQWYASNITNREGLYNLPVSSYAAPPWPHGGAASGQRKGSKKNGTRHRKDDSAQQAKVAVQDDHFGRILGFISPSKIQCGTSNALPEQSQKIRHSGVQTHHLPKVGALSVPVRPASATTTARSTACSDINGNSAKRPSSDQEIFSASAEIFSASAPFKAKSQTEHRTGNKQDCDPTASKGSEASMRGLSSNFFTLSRLERQPTSLGSKIGSAYAPSPGGQVNSCKEGFVVDGSDSLDTKVRHDQSLLPMPNVKSPFRAEHNADGSEETPQTRPTGGDTSISNHIEVIDMDVIDPSLVSETTADLAKLSPFKPTHKAGMSSISSTGRLEQQLYSALGEELGSFEQQMNTTGMGSELAQALSGMDTHSDPKGSPMLDRAMSESEPGVKRKRQGTCGRERNPSPTKKKRRIRKAMVEDADVPDGMLR